MDDIEDRLKSIEDKLDSLIAVLVKFQPMLDKLLKRPTWLGGPR